MGMSMLDNQRVEITCPNCREKMYDLLAKFKKSGYRCPKCKLECKGEGFRKEITRIERQLENLMREE